MRFTAVRLPDPSAKPTCGCGETLVLLLREPVPDGELLADNMGSDLGTERYAGPFCPACQADVLDALTARIRAGRAPDG